MKLIFEKFAALSAPWKLYVSAMILIIIPIWVSFSWLDASVVAGLMLAIGALFEAVKSGEF